MFLHRIVASVLMLAVSVQGESGANDMMVAFVCDRPAVHLADDRWIKDGDVGCLRRPNDILNYCRKVYPFADVERAEESKEKQTIGHWCRFGHVRCHEQFKVRPFRCIQAGADDVISSHKPSDDRQRKEQKQNAKTNKNFNKYHTNKIAKDNKGAMLEEERQTTDARRRLQHQQTTTILTRLIRRRQTTFDDFLASTNDRNAPALNVVRSLRRLIKALQRERIRVMDIYTHLNGDTDFEEGGQRPLATELQDVDRMLEKAMRRLDQMKHRKKIKLEIEDDLDDYHEFDDVISSLLRTTTTTTSTTTSPTTTRPSSQDDDYAYDDNDDDDDDDDDIMDSSSPGETNVTESKISEKINEEVDDDDDYYDGEDKEEDKEGDKEGDKEEHKLSEDAGIAFPSSSVPALVESKPSFLSRLPGKIDGDIVYDDYIQADGKRGANNFGQNSIRVKQSSLPKTSSRQGGRLDSALPLGISVSSLTVVVVIVVGIAVMRRRSRRHHQAPASESRDSRPSAQTPEAPPPRHVTNPQTIGYENPTYRYFEMRSE